MTTVTGAGERFSRALLHAGMSSGEAQTKAELFARAGAALKYPANAADAAHYWFVPGRIELFGKHTDYCGGGSILCAMERGFCVAARPRPDGRVHVTDAIDGRKTQWELAAGMEVSMGHWSNYPLIVVRRLMHNFPGCDRGMDMAFASDLPAAAGLSSSSALVVATFLAFSQVNQLDRQLLFRRLTADPAELACYLGAVESGRSYKSFSGEAGVGTAGGAADHTAVLCAQNGCVTHVISADAGPMVQLPWDPRYQLVIAVSGVAAEKTGAARRHYNRIALTAARAVELFNLHHGEKAMTLEHCFRLMHHNRDAVLRLVTQGISDPDLLRQLRQRLEQFDIESHVLMPAAVGAFQNGKIADVGRLADQSHRLAADLLQNQTPETNFLVRKAGQLGASAASAFGAGFGGSVWALLPAESADTFAGAWRRAYAAEFPAAAVHGQVFLTRPGPPAMKLA